MPPRDMPIVFISTMLYPVSKGKDWFLIDRCDAVDQIFCLGDWVDFHQ